MAGRRHQLMRGGLSALLLLTGCSTMPPGVPSQSGAARPVPESERAGVALIEQGRRERRSGHYAQAAVTLERAVRIAPAEPAVWLELARLRFAENNWSQAEQLARKARSLTTATSPLAAEADGLIADAVAMQRR